MKKRFLIAVVYSFLPILALAQKIRTIGPRQPVVVGNAFQLQYIITDPSLLTEVEPPLFDSLRLVSGPNHYKGNAMVDGKMQPIENITYTLVASRLGNIRIKGAVASFKNGNVEESEEMLITVLPHPRASFSARSSYTDISLYAPTSRTDLEKLINENLFIKAEVNKRSCFMGEAVVATYKLYSRLQSTSEVINAPSLYGFSVIDILNINEAHQSVETINGKVFNTSILRKLQLYPEQAGNLVIDEMQLQNEIEFDDSMSRDGKQVVEKLLVSKPVTIQVKALPPGRPDDFTGAVGQFDINAVLENARISQGTQGKLSISITGKGNFLQFGQPHPVWPSSFVVFDPVVTDRVNKNRAPTEGTRMLSFSFTADSAASYSLPSVQFSFFDPAAGIYRSVKTDSLMVMVKGSNTGLLKTREKNEAVAPGHSWILVWAGALIFIGISLLLLLRRKKRPILQPVIPPKPQYAEMLEGVNTSQLSDKEVCFEISRILNAAEKEHPGMTDSKKAELKTILKECQLMVYSSISEERIKEELKIRALTLLRDIENPSA